jgi:carboxyl-terminal processing protease
MIESSKAALPARAGVAGRCDRIGAVRGLLAALVLGSLAACSGSTGPIVDTSAPAPDMGPALAALAEASPAENARLDGAVFGVGYSRIADVYLDPVAPASFAVSGLDGLAEIDALIDARVDDGQIVVTRDGAPVSAVAMPWRADTRAWASATVEAMAGAVAASPLLAEADNEALYEAFYDAALDDLDDYSRYVDPDAAREERAQRDGYGGIGLLIEAADDRTIILQVFEDGPAAEAGIEAGWYIVAVDGVSAEDWDISEVGQRLRGRVGTPVSVGFELPTGEQRNVTLSRERVVPNVVASRVEGGAVIVEVLRFNAATTDYLAEAIGDGLARLGPDARGIVLDLRGNPGGLLGQAVTVADMFVEDGELIHTRGRHPDSIQRFDARRGDVTGGLPLVVLIDGRSASGAEIVAAALQDRGRAVLVGASTFGKGSVQTVTRLPNDGELYLTWSRIYAPSGYTFHRQGVMPTVCTSAGDAEAGALLARFRSGDLVVPSSLTAAKRAAPEDAAALARLREACPWRPHDADLDVDVALRIVQDRTLYAQALQASFTGMLAAR